MDFHISWLVFGVKPRSQNLIPRRSTTFLLPPSILFQGEPYSWGFSSKKIFWCGHMLKVIGYCLVRTYICSGFPRTSITKSSSTFRLGDQISEIVAIKMAFPSQGMWVPSVMCIQSYNSLHTAAHNMNNQIYSASPIHDWLLYG